MYTKISHFTSESTSNHQPNLVRNTRKISSRRYPDALYCVVNFGYLMAVIKYERSFAHVYVISDLSLMQSIIRWKISWMEKHLLSAY